VAEAILCVHPFFFLVLALVVKVKILRKPLKALKAKEQYATELKFNTILSEI